MRHVPSSDTAHAGVLSFEEALVPTAADFDRSRWLYVTITANTAIFSAPGETIP